jgi:hypothetical protein
MKKKERKKESVSQKAIFAKPFFLYKTNKNGFYFFLSFCSVLLA